MVNGYDIAMLTFSAVSANHLGLISAAERVLRRSLPIFNCPKCCTFWSVLLLSTLSGWDIISALAVSFLCAYLALWLEMLMGFIDTIYNKIYEKIYSTADAGIAPTADDSESDTDGDMSDVW